MANMSNLELYILTYRKNTTDENPVCNIFDFYNTYMKGLKSNWYRDFGPNSQKVLCFNPKHEDAAPSMGAFKDKTLGIYLYHCFGCNAHGNVVDLYILYNYYRFGSYIDRDSACKALASIYQIPIDLTKIDELADENINEEYNNRNSRITQLVNSYTPADYTRALRMKKRNRKGTTEDLDNISEDCIFYTAYLRNMFSSGYRKKELLDEEESNV